jgi:hypothetical protein
MKETYPSCCICNSEADWVRSRMPNGQQMSALCHRHYESLQQNNPTLASYYDVYASLPPRDTVSTLRARSYQGAASRDEYLSEA